MKPQTENGAVQYDFDRRTYVSVSQELEVTHYVDPETGQWVLIEAGVEVEEMVANLEPINALEEADKIKNLPIEVAIAAWLRGDKINVEGMGMKDTPDVSEANFSFGEAKKGQLRGSVAVAYNFPGLELGYLDQEGVRFLVLGVARKNTNGNVEYGVVLVDPANAGNQDTCSQKPDGVIETYSTVYSAAKPNNLAYAERVFGNIGKIIGISIVAGFDPYEMIEKLATDQDFSVIDQGTLFNDPGLSEKEQRLIKGYAKLTYITITDPKYMDNIPADQRQEVENVIRLGGQELETFLFQKGKKSMGVMNGPNEIAAWVSGEPVEDVTGLIALKPEDVESLDDLFFEIYGLCVVK